MEVEIKQIPPDQQLALTSPYQPGSSQLNPKSIQANHPDQKLLGNILTHRSVHNIALGYALSNKGKLGPKLTNIPGIGLTCFYKKDLQTESFESIHSLEDEENDHLSEINDSYDYHRISFNETILRNTSNSTFLQVFELDSQGQSLLHRTNQIICGSWVDITTNDWRKKFRDTKEIFVYRVEFDERYPLFINCKLEQTRKNLLMILENLAINVLDDENITKNKNSRKLLTDSNISIEDKKDSGSLKEIVEYDCDDNDRNEDQLECNREREELTGFTFLDHTKYNFNSMDSQKSPDRRTSIKLQCTDTNTANHKDIERSKMYLKRQVQGSVQIYVNSLKFSFHGEHDEPEPNFAHNSKISANNVANFESFLDVAPNNPSFPGSPENSFNDSDAIENDISFGVNSSVLFNNLDIKEKLNNSKFFQKTSQESSKHNSIRNSINNSKLHSLNNIEQKDESKNEGSKKLDEEVKDSNKDVKSQVLVRLNSENLKCSINSSQSDFLNLSCGKFVNKVIANLPYVEKQKEEEAKKNSESEKERFFQKNMRKWEKILNSADISVIKQMLMEVELNRIALFNKCIKELHQALKNTPDNFYLEFSIGIGNYGVLVKNLLPNDIIKLTKKGNKLVIEFSMVEVSGLFPKKRKTNLLINCEPGNESMYQKRIKKKTYTKFPIMMDAKTRDKSASDQARSAIASYYNEYQIRSICPKISKCKEKTKKGVIVEYQTHVDYEFTYYKNNVHKHLNGDKSEIHKTPEKDITRFVKVDYKKPFNLNTKFLQPIVQLLYIELPIMRILWEFIIGMTIDIEKFGFPTKICIPLSTFKRLDIKLAKYKEDVKGLSDSLFEIPADYTCESSNAFSKMMANPDMRTNYINFLFENLQSMNIDQKSQKKVTHDIEKNDIDI